MNAWDAVNPMNAFDNDHLDPLNLMGNKDKGPGISLNDQPKYPGFESLLDEKGNLPSNYMVTAKGSSAGLNEMRNRAMAAPGTSAWSKYQLGQNGLEESRAVQNAGAQSSGNMAQARSNLDMRGGSTSGARERIATGGMRDRMMATQDARNNAAVNRMGILGQDAQNSNNMLTNVTGQEMNRDQMGLQANEYNTSNQYNEKRANDAATVNEYNEKMKGWAAGKQAQATENAGKK